METKEMIVFDVMDVFGKSFVETKRQVCGSSLHFLDFLNAVKQFT